MQYKRSRFFNCAIVIRKALKKINQQFNANTKEEAREQKDKSEGGKSNIKWTEQVIAIFTVVLTVGTLALFYEAFRQTDEVKEEFKIANTPYLQLSKVLDSIHPGQAPIVAYSIENLGKVPCKIMWCEIGDSISNQSIDEAYALTRVNPFSSFPLRTPINMYAIDGNPYNAQYVSGYTLNDPAYKDLKSKQSFLYFYGTIGYVNQMSGEERIYGFNAKIIQNPIGGIEMIVNDNDEILTYMIKHRKYIDR